MSDVTPAPDLDDPTTDPFDVARSRRRVPRRRPRASRRHDVALVLGSGWGGAADLLGETVAELPEPRGPRVLRAGRRRARGHDPVDPHRRATDRARPRARLAHPPVRGPRRAARRARRPHRGRGGRATVVLTNGCGGLNPAWGPGTPVLISDHLNLTATSPLEGATFVDLTDLYSRAAARRRPRGRPVARRGRLRAVPRPALRDPGRGPDGRDARRRPRRHVDDARGHRRAARRPRGARHLAGHQPRAPASARTRCRTPRCSRPGAPPVRGSARCSPRSSVASEAAAASAPAGAEYVGPMTGDDAWAGLEARVQTWIDDDPDPQTADELRGLLDLAARATPGGRRPGASPTRRSARRSTHARRPATSSPTGSRGLLQFGTAGLRGRLGGGPHRMNRAVVIRAASGLADYLLGELDGVSPRAARGHRLRRPAQVRRLRPRHRRRADGGRASRCWSCRRRCPRPCSRSRSATWAPTPGSWSPRRHNPPQDNGYKVYLGGRVVTDSGPGRADRAARRRRDRRRDRARAVRRVGAARRRAAGRCSGPSVLDAYVATVVALAAHRRRHARGRDDAAHRPHPAARRRRRGRPAGARRGRVRRRARGARAGGAGRRLPERRVPQPGGARRHRPGDRPRQRRGRRPRDRARPRRRPLRGRRSRTCATARTAGPDTAEAEGWRMLHGDETGVAARARRSRRPAPRPRTALATFASSIVSSRLLGKIARAAGCGTRRRSPASSGSPASTAWCSATRRRSATASTRRTCATRTASRRRCSSPGSRHGSRRRGARSSTRSTTSPARTGCT